MATMSYIPRTFIKGSQVVVAEDALQDAQLVWEGWIPGMPVSPSRAELPAHLSDIDALQTQIDEGGGGGGSASLPAGGTSTNWLRGDGTWQTINKATVGLSVVDNTSDAAKPVSTAVATALSGKADLVGGVVPSAQLPSTTLVSSVAVASQAEMLALPNVVGTLAWRTDFSPDKAFLLQASPAATLSNWRELELGATSAVNSVNGQTGIVVLGKLDVGLGNVDNTSDVSKPLSTAMSSALAGKAPLASPTFTGTVSGITKGMVGLGNVDNTADASKPLSTAMTNALAGKADLASPTFTGTVGGITKTMVGLGNVDNTSDALKPISTAVANALTAKAPLNSPTFTGTVSGITKAMVGLDLVDNIPDAVKPVSSNQQAAINLKQDVIVTYATLTAANAAVASGELTDGEFCVIINTAA